VLDAGQAFGAHRAAGGRVRVPLDVGNYTVRYFDQCAAASVAAFAGGFDNFLFRHF
jgi:hypothetical protein